MNGKKTYFAAVVAIGYAVFAYLNHSIDAAQAGQLVETAVLGAFIRHGVSTGA
ncbi:hypothetical protein [Phenylobacterium sp.]|uniref:hypothetical protein n=1 Tax=Phenylobacterium sp. TaxID=1871053 RepID=UPI0025E7E2D1|nr:hypothetical protein [Phenylobacterium sp.]